MEAKEYIVAMTGASGAILGVKLLEALVKLGLPVHLIVSEGAKETLLEEVGIKVEELIGLASFYHEDHILHGPLASGSYISPSVEAMMVAPCSMKTLRDRLGVFQHARRSCGRRDPQRGEAARPGRPREPLERGSLREHVEAGENRRENCSSRPPLLPEARNGGGAD